MAASAGHADVVTALIAARAKLHPTAAELAAEGGKHDVLAVLAAVDAPMNIARYGHVTCSWGALPAAVEKGNLEVVKYLLAKKISANDQNGDGKSALTVATARGHTEIVNLLSDAGAKHYDRAAGA